MCYRVRNIDVEIYKFNAIGLYIISLTELFIIQHIQIKPVIIL